ncbi:sensor histidine kinase [Polyangium aurulentum]|uniref:sensor histidine kinase n=1 Tax=Polyangium aurulentum TaxID=2567896 RepID=UPI0010AEDB59|nr:sensor histidine kinase KdpD [Polyangium aurulentum]UQA55586.1 sensor histidine kinase KdpD [Polyangium aurulentum]
MNERRADPDLLLRRVQAEEARARRGKLKIFFGASPGVGKTYAMLEAARREKAAGRDVVLGYIETHGRAETAQLCAGLETLPRQTVTYRGKGLEELDLDAALRRRPAVVLVDELAHTNAPGVRHPKRWQDVFELLEAGIEVWTTLNVQHIESLNDVVSQVTHVRVRETLPDAVLERADEIELVDLPPDALLERLREGKVYRPETAERAEAQFFRRGNLLALRELALRKTAERVDTDVLAYRREQGIGATWAVAEHILVCIGPSPASADLVRAARRMAAGLRARWTAATVETPATGGFSQRDRARVTQHLRLAQELGASVATLSGQRMSEAILDYAREHNVTRIILGKPTHPRIRDMLFGSMLDEVVRGSGDIDVHVIAGEPREKETPAPRPRAPRSMSAYLWSAASVAAATALAVSLSSVLDLADAIMVYMLEIVIVAYRFGRGPALLASALSVATLDFYFVAPHHTFAVADLRHLATFAGLFLVGFVTSGLAERVQRQATSARMREARTATLYALARELSQSRDAQKIAAVAVRHVFGAVAGRGVVLLLPNGEGRLAVACSEPRGLGLDEREQGVAAWAFERGEPAGTGTGTLPGAEGLYLPLASASKSVGVLGILPADAARLEDHEQRDLLEALSHQIAMALGRTRLEEEAQEARLLMEREALRNTLLSSVSHDLRTPLAAITGAASTLLEGARALEVMERELLSTIYEEAERLNRLVSNLLDMSRLESGGLELHREWTPPEEVVGAALNRLERALEGRAVTASLPEDLPLVPLDGVLMGQVLFNLLDNAVKYTPRGSPIDISARVEKDRMIIEVADRGPGLPAGAEERLFDKFFRGPGGKRTAGTGLGLAICRGIVQAHGGTITAEQRPGGGAIFRIALPLGEAPPSVPGERA